MKLNRRHFLGVSAGALGAAALSGAGITSAFAQDQTIRLAFAARSAGSLVPASLKLTGASQWPVAQIFDTLLKAPDGAFASRPEDFQPHLAESWAVDETGKIWTVKIRPGVMFHKGYGELTAEDVAFTYRRLADPQILTAGKASYRNIASVDAPDANTAIITLHQPDPLLGTMLSGAQILSKAAFEEKGEEGSDFDPIGTGPYQFASGNAESSVVLEAYPEHFQGPPKVGRLQFDFLADTTARTLAFASGQVDVIEGVRSPGWVDTIKQRAPDTIFDSTRPGSHNYLAFNLNVEPLNNPLVRQAIRYAINNEQIASTFNGLAFPMTGLLADGVAGSLTKADLPAELQYEPSVDKAKALLAEAGFPNGFTIDNFMSQREDYASIMLMIQEQLRLVGITLNMRIIDHATYHTENRKDLNSLVLTSISYPPIPTQPFLDMLTSASEVKSDGSGGQNFSHYTGIDELLAAAMDQADFEERARLASEMEVKALTDLPVIGIITLSYVAARNPRLDLGYDVVGGLPNWRFNKASFV